MSDFRSWYTISNCLIFYEQIRDPNHTTTPSSRPEAPTAGSEHSRGVEVEEAQWRDLRLPRTIMGRGVGDCHVLLAALVVLAMTGEGMATVF
jgi:hypothetical protein